MTASTGSEKIRPLELFGYTVGWNDGVCTI
jgi:hypothetical protein